jgi:hypothetical protein
MERALFAVSAFDSAYMTRDQCQAEIQLGTFTACGITAFLNSLHIVINTVLKRMILQVPQGSDDVVVKTRDYRDLWTGIWSINKQNYNDHIRGFFNHRYSTPASILQKLEDDIKPFDNKHPCIEAGSFAGIGKGERTWSLVCIDKADNGEDKSQQEANRKFLGNKPVAIINTRQCFSRVEKEKALNVHRRIIERLKPLFADGQLLAPYRDTTRSTYIEPHSTVWSDFLEAC